MSQEKLNILLIEDEDPHAELIQRAFEEQNTRFIIHRVKSLGEARAEFRSKEPALIIADWRLPDGDSMELLPNQHDPLATPIILMTSYGNERIAVEALKSGALDYVVKSPESMLDMPHLAERAIEQWGARAERIRMQKALLESEAQFRLLAENASDMIARLSIDGIMLYVSPACKTILGYKPEDLTGTNCFDHIYEEEKQRIAAKMENAQKEIFQLMRQEAFDYMKKLIAKLTPKKDGSYPVLKKDMFERIKDFLEVFQARNICNDKDLAIAVEVARQSLQGVKISDLESNDLLKAEICAEFQKASLIFDSISIGTNTSTNTANPTINQIPDFPFVSENLIAQQIEDAMSVSEQVATQNIDWAEDLFSFCDAA